MVLNRLQEVDPVDHLAVGDQEYLVAKARWQHLDQLLVLVLRDERHDIRLDVLLDLLGRVKGNLSLPSELRETLDAILDGLLDLAAACQNGRKVTDDEGVEGHANQHPNEGEYDLCVRKRWYVTVAHRRNCLSGPMQRPDVVHSCRLAAETHPSNPGHIAEVVEFGGQVPEAGEDVRQKHGCDHTLNHTLDGRVYLH